MDLLEILTQARDQKFLGPLPLEAHLANGQGFVAVTRPLLGSEQPHPLIVDLGSGGGVPSCVLIEEFSSARFALVERSTRRAAFLEAMAIQLGAEGRVSVVVQEAEDAARVPELEGMAAVVTARSFAAPAVTAECAARFLRVGGALVVSEPPDDVQRWDAAGLAPLGLVIGERVHRHGATFQILHQVGVPDERYPRRAGVPRKRPLW